MAGVAGRSGGHNRSKMSADQVRKKMAPPAAEVARPEADWYIAECPRYTQKEIFEMLADRFEPFGITTASDGMTISFMAQQYHILQEATYVYNREGPAALIGRALASRIMTDAQKEITILLREFCMTPSTRSKRPDEQIKDDPLDNLLAFTH